jgi:hypothetical protein
MKKQYFIILLWLEITVVVLLTISSLKDSLLLLIRFNSDYGNYPNTYANPPKTRVEITAEILFYCCLLFSLGGIILKKRFYWFTANILGIFHFIFFLIEFIFFNL